MDSFNRDKTYKPKVIQKAAQVYFLLGGIFIAFLVVCNLIANKFVVVKLPFFSTPFILSAGVLPYPITFIITDVLSEFYGKKKAALVIFTGLLTSVLIIIVLKVGASFDAIEKSPVSNEIYNAVFGNSWRVIGASMTAYLFAQFADVQLYHFWKKITKGKYLWIRNNGSTIFSQLLDSIMVVIVLFYGVKSYNEILDLIIDGWLFKMLCALIDTPIIYLSVFLIRRYFKLEKGEEITF